MSSSTSGGTTTLPSRSSTSASSSSAAAGTGVPDAVVAAGRDTTTYTVGPLSALCEYAAQLERSAEDAVAVARAAADDAAQMGNAHDRMVAQHQKMFLREAFGINPDGSPVSDPAFRRPTKVYKSVKTVEQYNYIIEVLTNWGDAALIESLHPNDPLYSSIRAFRKKHVKGYEYVKKFELEHVATSDGFPKVLLKHKKSGKIILHMLDLFDVIHEAHGRQGHLKVDKTLSNCQSFFSPTYELCKLFIRFCYVCHEGSPIVESRKGAKRPILSSEFRDRFQVDLIDMRTLRRLDVYGQMQRWIMTVKDHSTGLVYLCALPNKMANYIAAELDKYFGFVGYPQIFQTGECYGSRMSNSVVSCVN